MADGSAPGGSAGSVRRERAVPRRASLIRPGGPGGGRAALSPVQSGCCRVCADGPWLPHTLKRPGARGLRLALRLSAERASRPCARQWALCPCTCQWVMCPRGVQWTSGSACPRALCHTGMVDLRKERAWRCAQLNRCAWHSCTRPKTHLALRSLVKRGTSCYGAPLDLRGASTRDTRGDGAPPCGASARNAAHVNPACAAQPSSPHSLRTPITFPHLAEQTEFYYGAHVCSCHVGNPEAVCGETRCGEQRTSGGPQPQMTTLGTLSRAAFAGVSIFSQKSLGNFRNILGKESSGVNRPKNVPI